jgi:glycosyltransferase involved in cell wall biosynthesis
MIWDGFLPLKGFKKIIKRSALKMGVEIRRASSNQDKSSQIVSLHPSGRSVGNVLFSYNLYAFLLKQRNEPIPYDHSGRLAGLDMVQTYLDLNYSVDIIDFHDMEFIPIKEYSFFVDFYGNLERIAPLLNGDCKKINGIQTAHWIFNNSAEYKRLSELVQRRGVCLKARRQLIPHLAIDYADYGIIYGNDFTCSTYSYAQKPLYRIPNFSIIDFPWLEEKKFETCRKNFLWFANYGCVHKGLDMVLDAFAQMPECHLTVCGHVEREEDFVKAFYKELYNTPNIHTIGWVDISSPNFSEIINHCVGLIFPSCSEGQSGSVVTCLHAGLIPIISYESGVDIDEDFGIILRNCSVEAIKDSIRRISSKPAQELEQMSRSAWEFAKENYTREKHFEAYRKAVEAIMVTRVRNKVFSDLLNQ